MTTKTKLIATGLLLIFVAAISFFLGRASTEVKEKVVTTVTYVPGDTVKIDVPYPEPYETVVYKEKEKIVLKDTTINVPKEIDTLALLKDYYTAHKYAQSFGSDTTGWASVDFTVTQNQVFDFHGDLVPVIKQIETERTIYKVPTFSWYAMVGTNLIPTSDLASLVKVSLGTSIKQKYMIGVSGYRTSDQNLSIGLDVGLQF